MRSKIAALIAAIALVVAACGTDEPLGPPEGLEGSWQLISATHQENTLEPISDHPVTIEFEDDEVTGTAACNGYGGSFELSDGEIEFSEIVITEMGCFPREVMELEQDFMSALASVTEVGVEDDLLVLSGEDTTLQFEALPAVPTAELQNTVWVLDGLVTGDSVSSVTGDRATLELFSDGSFLASTGCRTLAGNYVENADGVETTAISGEGECPADLIDQDAHVVSVLEGSYQVEIDTRSLYITTSDDKGLTYLAEG